MRARDILGPDGPISGEPGYEHRPGQLEMSDAVERALVDGRVLFCEAGTGTGKTIAYLTAAVLSGQRVVVSTATKALEDQIVEREIPRLERALGKRVDVAVAKGLSNYLCLRRYKEARRDPRFVYEHRRALPLLERWARETESGDLAEAADLGENDAILAEVASGVDTRIGSNCEHFDECFVTRMKRRVASAQLIVVNHHLFFADLAVKSKAGETAARAGVLPPFEAVIFDEAHRIEDVVSAFFGVRISRSRLAALARDAIRVLGGVGEGRALAANLERTGDAFFAAMARLVPRELADGRALLAPDAMGARERTLYDDVAQALSSLEDHAHAHVASHGIELVARRARALAEDLSRVAEPATHHVAWVEARGQAALDPADGASGVVLGASLIDVGPIVRNQVVGRLGGVVFTSATLASVATTSRTEERASEGQFSFLRRRLGLAESGPYPIDELIVASPFDFDEAALFYTPRDLPEPTDERFTDAATERCVELVEAAGGGAFVLTTSVRAMKNLGRNLGRALGRDVLVQGDAPKSTLLDRFRRHGHAVLVATMGFWEGVDVPGEALRLVVIDKLPFAVPSDAVVAARARAVRDAGLDPFTTYSVPDAAITLKQGVGRLLRSRTDWGVSAVLDRRLVTRGYGRSILKQLPFRSRTERLEDVRAFFESRRAQPGEARDKPDIDRA
ncbi:MAG: ATP-dependent DNA helicase [Polyangiaceae bacterium]